MAAWRRAFIGRIDADARSSIHRFSLIQTRSGVYNYSFRCIQLCSQDGSRRAAGAAAPRRARRGRRRDRLHRPGAAAAAGAPSGASSIAAAMSSGQRRPSRRLPALAQSGTARSCRSIARGARRDADLVFLALPDAAAAELAPRAGRRRRARHRSVRRVPAARRRGARAMVSGNARGCPTDSPTGSPSSSAAPSRDAQLVANPGCYPTATLLALAPLVDAGLLLPSSDVIVDAKSGVSGAGKTPTERTHFSEVHGSLSAYGVFDHRHGAEIEQGAGRDGHLHAAPGAARPRHPGDDLRPRRRRARPTRRSATCYERRTRRDRSCGSSARRCRKSSTSRTRTSATSAGASTRPAAPILVSVIDNLLKGAVRSGGAEHERDARPRRADGAAVTGALVFH